MFRFVEVCCVALLFVSGWQLIQAENCTEIARTIIRDNQRELAEMRGLLREQSRLLQENVNASKRKHAQIPKDCTDIEKAGNTTSGVYTIYIGANNKAVDVYCEMATSSWTVLQRRQDGTVNFHRGWEDYKKGFGHLKGEFWLGNEWLHLLTNQRSYVVKFDLWDGSNHAYAFYKDFKVGAEWENFKLTYTSGSYRGTAGNSFNYQNGEQFSTKDTDNDSTYWYKCSDYGQGAWWYGGWSCMYSNLNGQYGSNDEHGILWHTWKGSSRSLSKTEIKIRPII